MKRFHVHLSVEDLPASIAFYSRLFGAAPSVEKPDYARWLVEDPRLNFAISTRAGRSGIEHLGLQVGSAEELDELGRSFAAGGTGVTQEQNARCCYARSDKYWVNDPQGVAWEGFHTHGETVDFGGDVGPATDPPRARARSGRCCAG